MHTSDRLATSPASYELQARGQAGLTLALCKALGRDGIRRVADHLLERESLMRPADFERLHKGATGALVLGTGAGELSPYASAIWELVDRRSAFGQIPFMRAPIGSRIAVLSGSTPAGRVLETEPIPVVGFGAATVRLDPAKIALIVVYTREVAESPTPDAVNGVQRVFLVTVSGGVDLAAFDPTVTGSIAASGVEVTSTGSTADAIETDIETLLATLTGGAPTAPYLVYGAAAARQLAFLRTPDGTRVFPDVRLVGQGSIVGVPAFVSPHLDSHVIGVDADAVVISDTGGEIDTAKSGALVLDTDPGLGAQLSTSLFETNSIALRAIRYLSWQLGRDDAAAYLTLPTGSPA